MDNIRVLYFTSNEEDYLSDGLLHGLRTLLGDRIVDFPKHELMYSDASAQLRARSHGRAFTLYGRLSDIHVDRFHVLRRARQGEFDLVVFSDIHRQFGYLLQLWGQLDSCRVAILDGSDSPEPFPQALRYLRVPSIALFPRLTRFPYFKRELDESTARAFFYRTIPVGLSHKLSLPPNLRPLAFSIPRELVVEHAPVKQKDFPRHIVDEEVLAKLGQVHTNGYRFESESDYVSDLRSSRFGITMKRAGWDCLRHYEIAAAGAVPCFRRLDLKHPRCAPHGLNASNTIIYRDANDLFDRIKRIGPDEYAALQAGALSWASENTTVARARAFLELMFTCKR
jgi:hypothetical protein